MSGGQPEFIEPLARAATAVGIDGLFMEVHDRPHEALSDPATQFPLEGLPGLLQRLLAVHRTAKNASKSQECKVNI